MSDSESDEVNMQRHDGDVKSREGKEFLEEDLRFSFIIQFYMTFTYPKDKWFKVFKFHRTPSDQTFISTVHSCVHTDRSKPKVSFKKLRSFE